MNLKFCYTFTIMHKIITIISCFMLSLLLANAASAALPQKIAAKVLYVGLPDTDRTNSFKSLLDEHFTSVTFANYNTFQEPQTADADVVILDKDGIEWKPLDIELSKEYSKPTITIGTPGAFWCGGNQLKIRYM